MIPITFTVGSLPIGWCWTGGQDFLNLAFGTVGPVVTGSIPGVGAPVIVSATSAGVDLTSLWARTVGGIIEGIYSYSGGWFRAHPVPPSSASRIIWTDIESALWAYDGGDGSNPATNPPTTNTGAMWVRDTNFGADDGSACFRVPVGAGVNPTAYDGNAATAITVGSTSGEERHILTAPESGIPSHTHSAFSQVATGGLTGTANPLHDFQGSTGDINTVRGVANIGGASASNSHTNMPPYYGVIFAKRSVRVNIGAT